MGTLWLAGPAELRRRRSGTLALLVAAALGLAASLGAFLAAYRTEHAYPEHVRRARMADLVVNPSLTSEDSDRVIRSLPHVRHVDTYELTAAGYYDAARMHTLQDVVEANPGQLYASPDGHYLDSDRLIVTDGRRPTGHREVFVTEEYRDELARQVGHPLRVGQRIPVGFIWSAADVDVDDPGRVPVESLGVVHLRISGFGRMADGVLSDRLYPPQNLIISADVARRRSCPPGAIPDSQDPEVLLPAIFPPNCSVQYRYYALRLDDPDAVGTVARLAQRRLSALNPALWRRVGAANAENISYYPVVTTRRDTDARVERAVRPTVFALNLFGWVAAVATVVVVGLAAARTARDGRSTDRIVRALGAGSVTRWSLRILPAAVGTAVGIVVGIGIGVLLSPIGPVGEVARVSAHRSVSAPGAVVVPFALVVTVVLALTLGAVGALAGQGVVRPASSDRFRRIRQPEIADGVGAAFASGRAALVPLAAAVALTAVVATVVFASNLGRVVDAPARYGWPWQLGVLTGAGYGDTDVHAVRSTLAPVAAVTSWNPIGVNSATADGRPLPLLTSDRALPLPVVSGRLPRHPGELALGRHSADALDVGVGGRVRLHISNDTPTRRVRVVGIVALPTVGQYSSDRTGLGVGGFTVVSKAAQRRNTTFTGVRLREPSDRDAVLASIRRRIPSWDAVGEPPTVFRRAVEPPEILNVDAMRAAPAILAGLLALAMLGALGLALTASVKARRRDYAVLRAIGFRRDQVGRSVRWQGLATMVVGVLVGVPAGVVVGRLLWTRFADELGIAPDAALPVALLALVAVAAVVAALLATWLPARRAGRRSPAEDLATQ